MQILRTEQAPTLPKKNCSKSDHRKNRDERATYPDKVTNETSKIHELKFIFMQKITTLNLVFNHLLIIRYFLKIN